MSYNKTTWQTGDVVTAEKLNKLEDGVQNAGGGVEFIKETYDEATSTSTLDKTYSEITAMVESGKLPVIIFESVIFGTVIHYVQAYYSETEDETTTYFVGDYNERVFIADSADGTLTYTEGGGGGGGED